MNGFSDFKVLGERELTGSERVATRPNWNADGRSIVFEALEVEASRLYSLGVEDRVVTALALCNEGGTRVQGRPAFFAQDDFAFVSDRSGSCAIWRCDLQRGVVKQLTWPTTDESDYGPAAPGIDSSSFLFFRNTKIAPSPHVYLGVDGSNHEPRRLTISMSNQPWFVPQADAILYHSKTTSGDAVYTQTLEPTAVAQRLGEFDTGTSYTTPFPSADGRHLAFTMVVAGVSQIFVMRIDGSNRQQLTFADEPSMFPAWSPVDNHLVVVRGDPTADAATGRLVVVSLTRTR